MSPASYHCSNPRFFFKVRCTHFVCGCQSAYFSPLTSGPSSPDKTFSFGHAAFRVIIFQRAKKPKQQDGIYIWALLHPFGTCIRLTPRKAHRLNAVLIFKELPVLSRLSLVSELAIYSPALRTPELGYYVRFFSMPSLRIE